MSNKESFAVSTSALIKHTLAVGRCCSECMNCGHNWTSPDKNMCRGCGTQLVFVATTHMSAEGRNNPDTLAFVAENGFTAFIGFTGGFMFGDLISFDES